MAGKYSEMLGKSMPKEGGKEEMFDMSIEDEGPSEATMPQPLSKQKKPDAKAKELADQFSEEELMAALEIKKAAMEEAGDQMAGQPEEEEEEGPMA